MSFKLTPNKCLEKDVVRHILEYLRVLPGCKAGKTKTTGMFDPRRGCYRRDPFLFTGFPDITGFYKSRLFFLECKSDTGRLSPEQEHFRDLCAASNTPYIVARSVSDVQTALEQF